MNSSNNSLRFVPLKTTSTHSVLYYDSDAPLDAIFETVETRVLVINNLLSSAHRNKDSAETLAAAVAVSSLLLNDITSPLQELNPIALQLRREEELRVGEF